MMKSAKTQVGSKRGTLQVRVYWGDILYDTVLASKGHPVTVGREPGCTFVMDLGRKTLASKLTLVELLSDGTAKLVFDGKMQGDVRHEGKRLTLEKIRTSKMVSDLSDGLHSFVLAPGDGATIVVGYVSFDISWVGRFTALPIPSVFNSRSGAFLAATLATFALIWSLDHFKVEPVVEEEPERIVEIVVPQAKKVVVVQHEETPTEVAGGGLEPPEPSKPVPPPPPPPSAAEKLKSANLSGLVSSLSSLGESGAPKIDNPGPVTQPGRQPTALTSSLSTAQVGKSVSISDKVSQQSGSLVGAAGVTTGTGSKFVGANTGYLGAGSGTGSGGIDKKVVDQIVRRRQDRIKLCYERQLNFQPGLSGKVTVQFQIGKTGEVVTSSISEDTMKSGAVSRCILAEVKTWQFPPPKGETDVLVDYPFVFESSGGERAPAGQ